MTLIKDWDHTWFGFWKEGRNDDDFYPSVYQFIESEFKFRNDIEKIYHYLLNAQILISTSWVTEPCVVCGYSPPASLCLRSDGVYLWPDSLEHYIKEHDVALPARMLQHLIANDFQPPPLSDEQAGAVVFPRGGTFAEISMAKREARKRRSASPDAGGR